jgi:hypothetical protein
LQLIGNHLIGENIMLMEQRPRKLGSKWKEEVVAPNYFNTFMQESPCNENDIDDESEMKFLQNRFKSKFEILPKMYTGCIFRSRDYLSAKSDQFHQTDLLIVNTFSYYQWRSMHLLKRARILLEDLSTTQI